MSDINVKPLMKSAVALDWYGKSEHVRCIYFWASADAITDFECFGNLHSATAPGHYVLYVDTRYDFDAVVAYIKGWG